MRRTPRSFVGWAASPPTRPATWRWATALRMEQARIFRVSPMRDGWQAIRLIACRKPKPISLRAQARKPTVAAARPATWGDYTAMSVDPVDDCTFWYTNEYYSSQANG